MKIKTPLTLIAFLMFFAIYAQRPKADIIKSTDGDITIQPITHGTLVLEWKGKTIYVDPYGGAEKFKDLAAPDIILITDIHGEIRRLCRQTDRLCSVPATKFAESR